MRVLGATCGVGSMLIGAREVGFDVLGNIEWRDYYHVKDEEGRNTFTENFKGSFFVKKIQDLNPIDYPAFHSVLRNSGIDLIMGHPDCGNYSVLSQTTGDMSELLKNPGDIPIFVDIIKRLKPRFFVQDNLQKSLLGHGIEEWAKALPEYDIFPENVSNWRYGNIQKMRNRLFIIGALKTEKFSFSANEGVNTDTVSQVLYDNPLPTDNNEEHSLVGKTSKGKGIYGEEHMTWPQLSNYILNHVEEGKSMIYMKGAEVKRHVGTHKFYKDKHALVLTGGSSFPLSPWTGLPFSIRERARMQGCPDDFIFYGTKLEINGKWRCMRNPHMVKQIAKFMPIQFCTFVSQQIADHINGKETPSESVRHLASNAHVDKAKIWYCGNVGYSDQESVCKKCWIIKKKCPLKR